MKLDQIWLDLREKNTIAEVENIMTGLPIKNVLVKPFILKEKNVGVGKRIQLAFLVENEKELREIKKDDIVISEKEELLKSAKAKGHKCGFYVKVIDRESLNLAWSHGIQYEYLIIEFKDPTNIPLELVIAQIEDKKADTILLKVVNSIEDAKIASQVLERGSDGVLLNGVKEQELSRVNEVIEEEPKVNLQEVEITSIEYIGLGDRGCIDTTSLMGEDEGMIIGSTSAGGIFVCSETHFLPYMELRPFRVNAGAVHSYVMAPDNTTRYMSELKCGEKVSCINTKGEVRTVSVGRNKIEKRPLLLIKGKIGEVEINTILQDDWHVRVMGIDGQAKNITTLEPGDKVFGALMKSGRHVGLSVSETILEK